MVFVEGFYEIVNVRSHDLDVHPVGAAYFVRDAWLVLSLLYQFKNFRADSVDREHLDRDGHRERFFHLWFVCFELCRRYLAWLDTRAWSC